jgi:hypothetical protein
VKQLEFLPLFSRPLIVRVRHLHVFHLYATYGDERGLMNLKHAESAPPPAMRPDSALGNAPEVLPLLRSITPAVFPRGSPL